MESHMGRAMGYQVYPMEFMRAFVPWDTPSNHSGMTVPMGVAMTYSNGTYQGHPIYHGSLSGSLLNSGPTT